MCLINFSWGNLNSFWRAHTRGKHTSRSEGEMRTMIQHQNGSNIFHSKDQVLFYFLSQHHNEFASFEYMFAIDDSNVCRSVRNSPTNKVGEYKIFFVHILFVFCWMMIYIAWVVITQGFKLISVYRISWEWWLAQ